MSITNFGKFDYQEILSGSPITKDRYQQLMASIIAITSIIEGPIAPTFTAAKHTQYFDTVTSKYYRNTDGGTTWVALN